MANLRKLIKKVATAGIASSIPYQKRRIEIRKKTALALTLGILWLATGVMAADRSYDDPSPESKVKMFFMVTAKNATSTLFLNGKEIPWLKMRPSV